MTKDDITRMAREAGFVGFDGDNGALRRFAALIREECANICEDTTASWADYIYNEGCMDCAKAIRSEDEND